MKDGIYYVEFSGQQGKVGSGTVVVTDNKINGGDFGFTYKGTVEGEKLDLHVSQHNRQAQNVLGIANYTINLAIKAVPTGTHLTGAVAGHPQARLEVHAKFIGDLI